MATPASTVAGTRVVKIGDASLEVRTRATRARDGATATGRASCRIIIGTVGTRERRRRRRRRCGAGERRRERDDDDDDEDDDDERRLTRNDC